MALIREFEQPAQLNVHHLIAELYEGVDWVLVEGFKHSDLQKIEIWRDAVAAPASRQPRYAEDDFIVALATDAPHSLPLPTGLPVFNLNDVEAIARWLMQNAGRFEYNQELYGHV